MDAALTISNTIFLCKDILGTEKIKNTGALFTSDPHAHLHAAGPRATAPSQVARRRRPGGARRRRRAGPRRLGGRAARRGQLCIRYCSNKQQQSQRVP
jgi:hypothetical protein